MDLILIVTAVVIFLIFVLTILGSEEKNPSK